VKRSCDLLSHPLKIKSQIGRGTHFTVLVPIAPDSSRSPESTIEELSMAGGGFKDLHVIVIEDDLLSSRALTGLLRCWGCHVSTFHDADHACSGISRNQVPDVIVSDYRLPGKRNGVDAIRTIRQICECSIPSVLISGDKNEELRLLASTEGLVLLTKPLQPAKLRNFLRRLKAGS
jgi:two-component system, sensor histidine kinase